MTDIPGGGVEQGYPNEENADGQHRPGHPKIGNRLDQSREVGGHLVATRQASRGVDRDEGHVEELVEDGGDEGEARCSGVANLAVRDHDREVVDHRHQHQVEEQRWRLRHQHSGEPGEGDRDPAEDDAQPQQPPHLDRVHARREERRDRRRGQQAHWIPLPGLTGACHHIASPLAPVEGFSRPKHALPAAGLAARANGAPSAPAHSS